MRSIWTGSIGFGLVSIPIKVFSAVQETRLDLDMLDSRDHAHIKFQRVNENTKKEVPYDKIVKGYKYDDDYVIIEDADLKRQRRKQARPYYLKGKAMGTTEKKSDVKNLTNPLVLIQDPQRSLKALKLLYRLYPFQYLST